MPLRLRKRIVEESENKSFRQAANGYRVAGSGLYWNINEDILTKLSVIINC